MAWMYVDIRIMEIRVNKALQRIDGKWLKNQVFYIHRYWYVYFSRFCLQVAMTNIDIFAKTPITLNPNVAKSHCVNLTKIAPNTL